jgi:hypothetical protein
MRLIENANIVAHGPVGSTLSPGFAVSSLVIDTTSAERRLKAGAHFDLK